MCCLVLQLANFCLDFKCLRFPLLRSGGRLISSSLWWSISSSLWWIFISSIWCWRLWRFPIRPNWWRFPENRKVNNNFFPSFARLRFWSTKATDSLWIFRFQFFFFLFLNILCVFLKQKVCYYCWLALKVSRRRKVNIQNIFFFAFTHFCWCLSLCGLFNVVCIKRIHIFFRAHSCFDKNASLKLQNYQFYLEMQKNLWKLNFFWPSQFTPEIDRKLEHDLFTAMLG